VSNRIAESCESSSFNLVHAGGVTICRKFKNSPVGDIAGPVVKYYLIAEVVKIFLYCTWGQQNLLKCLPVCDGSMAQVVWTNLQEQVQLIARRNYTSTMQA
jgi:hypothetical protein